MRLFAALYPPPEAVTHLAAAVAEAERTLLADPVSGGVVRLVPAERWHLTVAFYGEDDPDRRAEKLTRRAGKLLVHAPSLRCAGAGTFGGVLWVGVRVADGRHGAALRALARAAGVDPRQFRPHITVARWSKGRPDRRALTAPFADYLGPWWRPAELLLMRSELGAGAPRYTVLHRVTLPPVADDPPG